MKTYNEYKDSGVSWIGKIPVKWTTKKVKYMVDLISDKRIYNAGEYIGLENIESFSGKYVKTETQDAEGQVNTYETGDLLFGKLRPYLAKCYITKSNGCCSSEFLVLRDFKGNNKYLQYLFLSATIIDVINASTYGAKMPRANWNFIGQLFFPLPPLDTQHRIADCLDRKTAAIDTLIEDKQKMIELLKERRQAIISEAVTKGLDKNAKMKDSGIEWIGEIPEDWEVIRIKYLCEIKRGASPRPIDDSKYFDDNGNRFWVRISDVTNTKKYLTKCEQRLSSIGIKCSVPIDKDDFFVSICASVGKPCISKVKACIHDGFVLFKGLNRNLNNYMYYIFDTGIPFAGLGKLGTQLNLNSETIGNIYIPIHKDIIRISTYLDKKTSEIDNLITDIATQIEKLKEYRQAIISEAVTGKVEI